ncbi:MAG: site-specific integrase, partial [Dolichospermum sp.]
MKAQNQSNYEGTYSTSTDNYTSADSKRWFTDMFADFEPQNTTDGSYRGTMAKIKATELQYQAVFEQKLI